MTEKEIIEAHLKAQIIFDANNTNMTVKKCAEFLDCSEDTIRRGIKSGDIIASYKGGWRIPKLQFHKELIDRHYNTRSTSPKVAWHVHPELP